MTGACSGPIETTRDIGRRAKSLPHPEEFAGKSLFVSARHETVAGYEDYLIDEKCSGGTILQMGEWSESTSASLLSELAPEI
jgi:hypothetical protein